MRLSAATLDHAKAGVSRFAYARDGRATGIVHFGIGAFHRAHMAWHTDRAMDAAGPGADGNWMIAGISMRSADVAARMNPQDGLYSVVERSATGAQARIVGAVGHVLVAPRQPDAVAALLAAPATRIASFTITEKGYCRAADGALDQDRADGGSIYALLVDGLSQRRAAGLPGLTLLSCDNLADNGRQLESLMAQYCARHDPGLGAWIAATCTFPCTMVDRIVPATTAADRALAAGLIGLDDAAAVMTEPFSQWVIEDRFAAGRPAWDAAGAQLVSNVAAYETAKLRMLNGAHSALAYLGLLAGYTFVHQAVDDPAIRAVAERLMRDEALPSIPAAAGQNLDAYADALLARFANPALDHRLIQIAMDGSQKIPQRWLETLAHHQRAGRRCPAILAALAAWLRHLRGDNATAWGPVDDPRADVLAAAWARFGRDGIVDALFGTDGLIRSAWHPDETDRAAIAQHL